MSSSHGFNIKNDKSCLPEIQPLSLFRVFFSNAVKYFQNLSISSMSSNDEEKIKNFSSFEESSSQFTSSLIEYWNLPTHSRGFFLSSTQFSKIAEIFEPLAKEKDSFNFEIYTGSGHVTFRLFPKIYVFPTYGLSVDFPFKKWKFKDDFCREWIRFAQMISGHPHYFIFISVNDKISTILMSKDPFTKCIKGIPPTFPRENFKIEIDTIIGNGSLLSKSELLQYDISPDDEIIL